jgi:hypothetical protein
MFSPIAKDLDTLCLTHKIDPFLRVPYWDGGLDFDLPDEYEALVLFQQTLHADSLFMGCISTEWSRIQTAYLKLNNYPRKKGQTASGLGAILTYLLDLTYSAWLKRNLALHGDDSTTKLLSYKHTQLLLETQELYDQVDSMLASDRSLFTEDYEYWLTQPTTQLLTFIKPRSKSVLPRQPIWARTSVRSTRTSLLSFQPIFLTSSSVLPTLHPLLRSHRNQIKSWKARGIGTLMRF